MPLYRMGEEAARILLEKEDNAETIHKVLPSQLIIRNSAIPFKRIVPVNSSVLSCRLGK
jgi:DNA-binding LacI/PurR family transcriptional regulator